MARPRWKRLTTATIKTAVALVVLWGVGHHVIRTWNRLRDEQRSLRFEPVWLVVSGLLYLAGLSACGRFYERILRSSSAPVRLAPALRAYVVSHLGKYVPGKAMVVVIRAGMVVPYGGRASTAAIATFYETLVMMAAGGLVAAAGFAVAAGPEPVEIRSTGLGHGSSFPSTEWPPWRVSVLGLAFLIVGRAAGVQPAGGILSALPLPGVGADALPRITAQAAGSGSLLVVRPAGSCWA